MTTPESSVPSLSSLVDRLTTAAYDLDNGFKTGQSDSTVIKRMSKFCVALADEDDKPLYNKHTLSFTATRDALEERRRKPLRPHLFVVKFSATTQLSEIPKALEKDIDVHLLDDVLLCGEIGDFTERQAIKYTIDASEGDVDIQRNISYTLTADKHIRIHNVAETDDSAQYEYIPLPHEQTTLNIMRRQERERIDDLAVRIPYEIAYGDMIDGVGNSVFFNELSAGREAEATLSILALVGCLKSGASIPNILETIPE